MIEENFKKKIAMIGTPYVGKSSLIKRHVLDEFDDSYVHTIGSKVIKKKMKKENTDLIIWDTNGYMIIDPKCKELFEKYLQASNGLVIVYDSTNKQSYNNLVKSLYLIQETIGQIPAVFIANKIDLTERLEFEEKLISGISSEWDSDYFLTSAKTGRNVEKAFKNLTKRIID